MSKKFDVVIGNPPYQEESKGNGGTDMPVYHQFMDAAYEVGQKAVLITPARFLFHAGHTPKAWKYVPLQDFTCNSDIDWYQSVANIDRQLYAKYGLDNNEITFIESHVRDMN